MRGVTQFYEVGEVTAWPYELNCDGLPSTAIRARFLHGLPKLSRQATMSLARLGRRDLERDSEKLLFITRGPATQHGKYLLRTGHARPPTPVSDSSREQSTGYRLGRQCGFSIPHVTTARNRSSPFGTRDCSSPTIGDDDVERVVVRAVVLCVEEKPQIQALERSQPVLPMRPGLPERRTHDYRRPETTSLLCARRSPATR